MRKAVKQVKRKKKSIEDHARDIAFFDGSLNPFLPNKIKLTGKKIRFVRNGKLTAPRKQSHPRLRQALSMIKNDCLIRDFPNAIRLIIWELMKTQTRIARLEGKP
jgi:hypothetical protein